MAKHDKPQFTRTFDEPAKVDPKTETAPDVDESPALPVEPQAEPTPAPTVESPALPTPAIVASVDEPVPTEPPVPVAAKRKPAHYVLVGSNQLTKRIRGPVATADQITRIGYSVEACLVAGWIRNPPGE